MTDVRALFERQAAWQRARARLSWPEKIRLAETMRETALVLRRKAGAGSETVVASSPEPARP